jgi:hypothetical protein
MTALTWRKTLLWIPLLVYLFSYIYLAIYHSDWWLFDTIVHEGGKYDLLETTFYASHFIGHIPTYMMLSLYFVGIYLLISDIKPIRVTRNRLLILLSGLILLLVFSAYIAVNCFGYEETVNYVLQKKQSVERYEEGGSWNLHLPSTLMQFLLIPAFIIIAKSIFRSKMVTGKRGMWMAVSAVICTHLITVIVNSSVLSAYQTIWTDPRYLAHSVRELATFPLTYYTIPLYIFLMRSRDGHSSRLVTPRSAKFAGWITSILFLLLFAYQCVVPLQVGIGDLAQKPDFAKGGELPILYLLASHYFEHFLDSLFFILFSLILFYSYIRIKGT